MKIIFSSTYTLPRGTLLYRGDTERYLSPSLPMREVEYFTELDHTYQYGIPQSFQLRKKVELIPLDNPTVLRELYEMAPDKVKRDLNYAFFVKKRTDDEVKIIRTSDPIIDHSIANYICSLGFDGYGTKTLTTDHGGEFHPEIMLCSPDEYVEYQGTVLSSLSDLNIDEYIQKHRMIKVEQQRKQRRRQRKSHSTTKYIDESTSQSSSPPIRMRLFS